MEGKKRKGRSLGLEVAMKERWKTIATGLWLIVLTILGVFEYVQLMKSFDLPQILLVVPLLGAVSVLVLKKKCFFILAGTVLLSCMYQILVGDTNVVARLQTSPASITVILLECLSVLIVFELLGMGGGALIRMLPDKNKKLVMRAVACVAGVLVTLGPYFVMFHNPMYPITARLQLKDYAEEHFTDYPIAQKKVYYSMQNSDYMCRVSMADGKIRIIAFDADGTIKQQ